ncbi:hypothetical protein BaRGS_00033578 [Batillaria attramentaria]|uniref:Uncharacterized protein n=1 Tax=Batillaria attramentaria TaxID=370345 RepID=A0ABD0JJK7_9CAEN
MDLVAMVIPMRPGRAGSRRQRHLESASARAGQAGAGTGRQGGLLLGKLVATGWNKTPGTWARDKGFVTSSLSDPAPTLPHGPPIPPSPSPSRPSDTHTLLPSRPSAPKIRPEDDSEVN